MDIDNHNVNPLLAGTRIPGATFQLPSAGLFYTNGELAPDVQNGEVHVYPMTALDEIVIKTPDKLLNGTAIEEVFARCIPSVQKPLDLLARDVDYLLICLRSVSFGPEVTVEFKHDCSKEAEVHEYVTSIDDFVNQVKRLDATTLTKEYKCVMNDGKLVYITPMRYRTIVDMMNANDPDRRLSPEELHNEMVDQLSEIISKVVIPDGGEGTEVYKKEFIIEWLKKLDLNQIRELNKTINNVSEWGPDTSFKRACQDCGKEVKIVAPLNPISFFT